jgi:hypothetical protein
MSYTNFWLKPSKFLQVSMFAHHGLTTRLWSVVLESNQLCFCLLKLTLVLLIQVVERSSCPTASIISLRPSTSTVWPHDVPKTVLLFDMALFIHHATLCAAAKEVSIL